MVEVFKTNVTNPIQAMNLVGVIENYFHGYKANFDLEDCDHILRIEVKNEIDVDSLVRLLKRIGVSAEVLSEEIPIQGDFR